MFKKSLTELFVNFNVDSKEHFNLFYEKLKESGVSEQLIDKNIRTLMYTFKPEFGRKMPCIAEIIGINMEVKENAEIELAWDKFTKNCCNNIGQKPMDDWIYTLKKLIGAGEVEDMNQETEKWIKKEFLRIFPSLKAGLIPLQSEPYSYKIEGGSSIRIAKIEPTLEIGE